MKATLAILLLTLAAQPAFAVNFSGRWAIQSAAGARGGRGGLTILVLNHVGDEVTGTISGRGNAGTGSPVNTDVLGGKVEGDVISFYVWTGTDQPVKTSYRGTMSPAGDEIQFIVTGGRGGGFGATGGPGGQGGGQAGRGVTAGQTTPGTPTPANAAVNGGGPSATPQQVTAKRAKEGPSLPR
jgi:hypothetical protein